MSERRVGTREAVMQTLLVVCPTIIAVVIPASIPVVLILFASVILPILVSIHLGVSRDRTGWMWGLFLSWLGVLILACMRPRELA